MVASQRGREVTLRRAAILLAHLDADSQRQLLARLTNREANQLRRLAATLEDVDPLEVNRVVKSFVGRVTVASRQGPTSQQSGRRQTGDPASSNAGLQDHEGAASDDHHNVRPELQFLAEVSDVTLAQVVSQEHPQTVAVVLGALPAKQAARLLKKLSTELRQQSLRRLGRLESIPTDVLDEIAEHLRETISKIEPIDDGEGRRTLTSILSELDEEEKQWVTDGLLDSDGVVASAYERSLQATPSPQEILQTQPLNEAVAEFEHSDASPSANKELRVAQLNQEPNQAAIREPWDALKPVEADHILQSLTAKQLQEVLAQLPSREVMLALGGMDEQVVNRVVRRLTRKQAAKVRGGLASLSRTDLHEIERCKKRVAFRALEVFEPESVAMLQQTHAAHQPEVSVSNFLKAA